MTRKDCLEVASNHEIIDEGAYFLSKTTHQRVWSTVARGYISRIRHVHASVVKNFRGAGDVLRRASLTH